MATHRLDSNKEDQQEPEYTSQNLALVLQEVASIKHRMKQLELWQITMDMTLKAMPENK